MKTRITINEPLTVETLRKLRDQLKGATPLCFGCGHPAHRAFRCGVKKDGTRTCDCNITFELTPSN